jgi:hypothetical protein
MDRRYRIESKNNSEIMKFKGIFFIVLIGLPATLQNCAYSVDENEGPIEVLGHVYWYGSHRPAPSIRVDAYTRNIYTNLVGLGSDESDSDGFYRFIIPEYTRHISIYVASRRYHPFGGNESLGKPVTGRYVSPPTRIYLDHFIGSYAFADVKLNNELHPIYYQGKVIGSLDSFEFYRSTETTPRVIQVLGELQDSIYLELFDLKGKKIMREKTVFQIRDSDIEQVVLNF